MTLSTKALLAALCLASALFAAPASWADGTPAAVAAAAADDAQMPRVLRFARGRSGVTVQDALVRGETRIWRFSANAGQRTTLKLAALERNAVFQIWGPGARLPSAPGKGIEGQTLPGAGPDDQATQWSERLPETGDYLIEVAGTRGNASYRLTLQIAPN